MGENWATMLSSASGHDGLICELYIEGELALVVSNETGQFDVELANIGQTLKLPHDEFSAAVRACVEKLRDAIS